MALGCGMNCDMFVPNPGASEASFIPGAYKFARVTAKTLSVPVPLETNGVVPFCVLEE